MKKNIGIYKKIFVVVILSLFLWVGIGSSVYADSVYVTYDELDDFYKGALRECSTFVGAENIFSKITYNNLEAYNELKEAVTNEYNKPDGAFTKSSTFKTLGYAEKLTGSELYSHYLDVIDKTYDIVTTKPKDENNSGYNPNLIPNSGNEKIPEEIKDIISRVFNSAILILQIVSVGGIILAGIIYMYSSANSKAKIKEKMVKLVIGMVIVFAGSTIVNFVVNVFNDIIS